MTSTSPEPGTVQRYGRGGRWLHAGIYLTVLPLLATGWWFVLGGYDRRSPLALLTGLPDGQIHEWSGYAMVLVVAVWAARGARGLAAFTRETFRFRPGDGRWLSSWPRAVWTGRFRHHDGHFDPGQRLANVVMVATLAALVLSGLGVLLLPAGRLSLVLFDVHRWSAFLVTPVILGHILIGAGVLPGYRGVWRSMHLGGRLPADVAERVWPGWLAGTRRNPRNPGTAHRWR
jgi:formate dehydrogenase subunit gamma